MPILDDTITVDDSNDNEDVDVTDDEYHDAAEPMDDDDFFSQSDIVSRYLKSHECHMQQKTLSTLFSCQF